MTADDVIIISTSQSGSDVVVTFYVVSPSGGSILPATAVALAIQTDNAKARFQAIGLVLTEVVVVKPTTTPSTEPPTVDTGLTTAQKVGIIAGVIGGAIVIIMIGCVVYFM